MSERRIRVTREAFRERAALDTAVSRALLRRVAQWRGAGDAAGLYAGGCGGVRAAGYAGCGVCGGVRRLRGQAGFEAIERLAGGRAAVFHSGTIAFSWTMADTVPREDVMARFDEAADIMMRALRRLGIDARVGEVPGEYCPGQHSVNARGERKLMGVGQRLIRGAAHVGGVVVVSGGERIRDVLAPVYDALEVPWRPETVGSVEEEIGGAEYEAVVDAILDGVRGAVWAVRGGDFGSNAAGCGGAGGGAFGGLGRDFSLHWAAFRKGFRGAQAKRRSVGIDCGLLRGQWSALPALPLSASGTRESGLRCAWRARYPASRLSLPGC